MTVVLKDFQIDSKLFSNPEIAKELFSLKEYEKLAKRMILSYCDSATATMMLKSEDARSYMIEKLMIGTCRWVNGGKRGDHRAYLGYCGRKAIPYWLHRNGIISERNKDIIELDRKIHNSDSSGRTMYVYEITSDPKSTTPLENLINVENEHNISELLIQVRLTTKQLEAIRLVYIDGLTPSEASRQLGVTREAIRQRLVAGLRKLKEFI